MFVYVPMFHLNCRQAKPSALGLGCAESRTPPRGSRSHMEGEVFWLQRTEARGGQAAAKVGQVGERWGKLL